MVNKVVPDTSPTVLALRGLSAATTFTAPLQGQGQPTPVGNPRPGFQQGPDFGPWPPGGTLTVTNATGGVLLVQHNFAPPVSLLEAGKSYTITPAGFGSVPFGFSVVSYSEYFSLEGLGG
jgi:hypothetical protein